MLRKIFLGRLPRYFAFVFLKHLFLIMLVFGSLIYLITFVEILRKTAGDDFSMAVKVMMTAKQIPFVMEQILPLLMLITAIWTVISLSYKSELVVAKAVYVSVAYYYKFLLHIIVYWPVDCFYCQSILYKMD